jgi:hypothetical protein
MKREKYAVRMPRAWKRDITTSDRAPPFLFIRALPKRGELGEKERAQGRLEALVGFRGRILV